MTRVLLPALLGVLLLSGCSRASLLIVTDQYWKGSELESPRWKTGMERLTNEHRVVVDVVVVPYSSSPSAGLVGALEQNRGSLVLLSPIYSTNASALAAQFPSRRIIVFSADAAPAGGVSRRGPANLIRLVSDPTGAFAAAAARAAMHLGQQVHPGEAPQIAAVFSNDGQGQAALAGFRKGLDNARYQPGMSVVQVGGSADRSRLRSFIEDAQGRNVSLFVLAAPSLNAYAFDLLKNSTTPIVTEQWIEGGTWGGKVLFSLDKDIPSALMKIVETMGRPADNEIRIPWDIVTGAGAR